MKSYKDFSDFFTSVILEKIKEESSRRQNLIFVILGQTELLNDSQIVENIVDIETFKINANETIFDKEWFTRIFTNLNTNKEFHVLSYPQFNYLIYYIDSSFFKDRIVILKDNLRNLFPIKKSEYYEKIKDENIEERPNKIPIYQAEQIQIEDLFFYSVKLPNENFKTIDLFDKEKELIKVSTDDRIETVDISSDIYALDYFINKCIIQNDLSRKILVKIYPKQPISQTLIKRASQINYVLNQFGGALFEKNEYIIQERYQPSEISQTLLKKYWGQNAVFRTLKVYKNPDINNQISEISQGLIVDTIIKEYEKSRDNKITRDLFLTAPTGSGKSLLFQLPAFYASEKGDVTIVISPLIALMKDQVNTIIRERNFNKIAYLNSELSLIDRDKIIEKCHNSEIDILYMSPELFLSYDISYFIGERRLGLLVIDEAHLITTWGRDFRVDYWFLGNHIRKIRKYHNTTFPMVAVTATAIYGGSNDMVFDSIDSLVMHDPHIFIGMVKRDNITFVVNNHRRFERNYEASKLDQTVEFIKQVNEIGIKTLVYAPYTKHIRQILNKLRSENLDIAVGYYGSLPADQKELAYREFKSNTKKIMVSTKAFGMGVDISDIELVYHHAPSGLLPDYIQEIGRVARKNEIQGFAAINYSNQDQRFTKALHGMSALRHYQIKEVLKKIYKAYLKNNKSRNLLLAVEDFGYIFENAKDLDQKVLTALMMIEKDYLAKNRFNVLIARPKKLFVKVYARITDDNLKLFETNYSSYFTHITALNNGNNIIKIDLDKLWYNKFRNKSFPIVKREFYKGNLFNDENIELVPQLKISFQRFDTFQNMFNSLNSLFESIRSIFNSFNGSFFNQKQFIEELNKFLNDTTKSEKIGKFILSSYSGRLIGPGIIESNAFLQQRREVDGYKYRVFNAYYLDSFAILLNRLNNLFGNNPEFIVNRYVTNRGSNSINYVRLGYFLEMLELGTFEIKGGENPMVFIRINDPLRIERDSRNNHYSNTLLERTLEKHDISNQIFDHFFLRSFSNDERWNFIEDFFLGTDVDSLLNKHKGGEINNIDIVEFLRNNAHPQNNKPTELNENNNIHIFPPEQGRFYNERNLLTIETKDGYKTLKISKWISEDPVLFDKTLRKYKLKIRKEIYRILISKLRRNHFEYFKKREGLNLQIEFKGYDRPVKASVPLKDNPIDFYKWWIENTDKVYLSFENKIRLFDKVNLSNPRILRREHRRLLENQN